MMNRVASVPPWTSVALGRMKKDKTQTMCWTCCHSSRVNGLPGLGQAEKDNDLKAGFLFVAGVILIILPPILPLHVHHCVDYSINTRTTSHSFLFKKILTISVSLFSF